MANSSKAQRRDYKKAGYPSDADLARAARIQASLFKGKKNDRTYAKDDPDGKKRIDNFRINAFGERAIAFLLGAPYEAKHAFSTKADLVLEDNTRIEVVTLRTYPSGPLMLKVPKRRALRIRKNGTSVVVLCVWSAAIEDVHPIGWTTPAELFARPPVPDKFEDCYAVPSDQLRPIEELVRGEAEPSQPMLFEVQRDYTR